MSETVIHSTVKFIVQEYSPTLKQWMWAFETGDEAAARQDLEEMRRIYPEAQYRLIKIEKVSTVLEGPNQ